MSTITLNISKDEGTYTFEIEFDSGLFSGNIGFDLQENGFDTFVEFLNSSEYWKMHGDVSNGHETITFDKEYVTISAAHYLGNFCPDFSLKLKKDLIKEKISSIQIL